MSSPTPPSLDSLKQTRSDLRQEVYALRERPEDVPGLTRRPSSSLLQDRPNVDPALAEGLRKLFDQKAAGRREWLVMEIDELRRLKRGLESERIMRAFGVLHVVTPVKWAGHTVWGLQSGPVKISPWTEQEKVTLAKLCGISPSEIPAALLSVPVFSPVQIDSIELSQELHARALEACLETPKPAPAAEGASLTAEPGLLDLLQPGFADHLDVLFRIIQQEVKASLDSMPGESSQRLLNATQRGRHLVDAIRDLSSERKERSLVSLHSSITQWCEYMQQRLPSLRIQQNLQANPDQAFLSPQSFNHLLFTLLSGVADGLPEGTGMLGVSTRNARHKDRDCLHLEIRDGGGLATFAGVGRPLDQGILMEQNEEARADSDWLALAEDLDADLEILREDGIVSRVELWIYPSQEESAAPPEPPRGPPVWIVDDDDREFETVRHMMVEAGVRIHRLRSGSELREQYLNAPEPPVLVLLKYLLPDERGSYLRTWLYERDPELPVILVSAFTGTHPGIATAVHLPGTLYLQKPYDRQSLLDMLRMTIDETLPGL